MRLGSSAPSCCLTAAWCGWALAMCNCHCLASFCGPEHTMSSKVPSATLSVAPCSRTERQVCSEQASPSFSTHLQQPGSRSQARSAFARGVSTDTLQTRLRTREKRTDELRKMFSPGGVPSNERLHVLCQHVMDCGRGLFLCPGCWLLPANCVCGRYRVVRSRTKVVVHIHHNEW